MQFYQPDILTYQMAHVKGRSQSDFRLQHAIPDVMLILFCTRHPGACLPASWHAERYCGWRLGLSAAMTVGLLMARSAATQQAG